MILCIAGVDSSGGAGIAVDALMCRALKHAFIALETAYTVQTAQGVQAMTPRPLKQFTQELTQALAKPISAIKIGMLANADIIGVVSDCLQSVRVPIILDPVLAASRGGLLLEEAAIPVLRQTVMAQATLVTPNLPEMGILLGCSLCSEEDIEQAAHSAITQGMQAVLIKGGHAQGHDSCDYLYAACGVGHWFRAPRLEVSLRGTGCRLATSIACYMADGHSLHESVRLAKNVVYNLLHAAVDR